MSPFLYFYCFLKTLKMAFNTSSRITSFRSPGARVKVSDTKICPYCTAPTLIKTRCAKSPDFEQQKKIKTLAPR